MRTDNDVVKTRFSVSMNFECLDEKLRRFIELRNELSMLAEEIGLEVSGSMLFVEKNDPPAATDGS